MRMQPRDRVPRRALSFIQPACPSLTMLLRASRFWLAALAAAVALAFPTGQETLLTGLAALGAAAAFGLWRSGLMQVRRSETAFVLLPHARPLMQEALDDAASMIVACCDQSKTFEAALHGTARILKTELGALRVVAYRVVGADATHARVSELIEAQPGFDSAERRVHLRHSVLGQAITARRVACEVPEALVVPVLAAGGVVAAIEMTGMHIDIEPQALTDLLTLTQEQLSRLAEPAGKALHRAGREGFSARAGQNG